MRNKKLEWNTLSALVYQVTAVLCGFILPKAILDCYGSEVNGLVNSITQFVQMISFLELGVGAVIQSALYKPLADRDDQKISEVVSSGHNFFRKLAGILVAYIAILLVVFPTVVDKTFGFAYDATLILSMSISSFAQYYFGIVDGLLLKSDQKGYIVSVIDTVTLIINTLLCYFLVYSGFSIQVVKLTTAGLFLLRPVLVRLYIRRHYRLDRKRRYTKDPIEQKWHGVAQHISAIVLDVTDTVVLSLFSTMANVSVYSVYLMVVSSIKNLILSCFGGISPLLGELWAKQEREELDRYFGFTEWIIHGLVLFVWCCTCKLIVPFVLVYTKDVTDVNYNVPVFAILFCLGNALYCLRLPFNTMILAAGHYKSTQGIYIFGALINLVVTVLAVNCWGLEGVAVGTIVTMLYQVIRMGSYVIQRLQIHSFGRSAKQLLVDGITIAGFLLLSSVIRETEVSWFGWIILAVKHALVALLCIFVTNYVFYRQYVMQIASRIFRKIG